MIRLFASWPSSFRRLLGEFGAGFSALTRSKCAVKTREMKLPLFAVLTLAAAPLISHAQPMAPAETEKVEPAEADKTSETAKPDETDPKALEEKVASAKDAAISKFIKGLHFKTGKQTVADGAITIDLPEGFQFLNGPETRKVLVDLWGNPPHTADDALGLILPAGMDLLAEESWAVIVSFEETGYVSDEDAAKTDYDDLLKNMQEGTEANNKERRENGYPAMTLKGWALPPHYDAKSKVLHWAKDLAVEGNKEDALNYDVRVLGRRGVVSLNCLATMSQVKEVEKHTPELVSMVTFNNGHTYADYDASTDKKAAYGIAGLIAGGAIAAKTGLLKTIWIAILAGKKFVILAVVGLIGLVKKIFGRRSE